MSILTIAKSVQKRIHAFEQHPVNKQPLNIKIAYLKIISLLLTLKNDPFKKKERYLYFLLDGFGLDHMFDDFISEDEAVSKEELLGLLNEVQSVSMGEQLLMDLLITCYAKSSIDQQEQQLIAMFSKILKIDERIVAFYQKLAGYFDMRTQKVFEMINNKKNHLKITSLLYLIAYYNIEPEINNYVNVDNKFLIGKYLITQEEYLTFMGNNPSNFTGKENLPVESVSWFDVINFCNTKSTHYGLELVYTINEKEVTADHSKNGYRLPTEQEWEYASKGGILSQDYKYSGSNNAKNVAWYNGNSGGNIHPVGLKKSNELGLYDMSGNVWEWCWDWYDIDKKEFRVLRGGSLRSSTDSIYPSTRNKNYPDLRDNHSQDLFQIWNYSYRNKNSHCKNNFCGFRCVRSL